MAVPHLPIGAQLTMSSKNRVCIPKLLAEQIAKPGEKVSVEVRTYGGITRLWVIRNPFPGHKTVTVDKYGNIRVTLPMSFKVSNEQAWWLGGDVIYIS